MNKIYKVVWSKVKHCYVVTSELAKRNGKGCSARSLRTATVSLGVAAALLGAGHPLFDMPVAEAATADVSNKTVVIDYNTDKAVFGGWVRTSAPSSSEYIWGGYTTEDGSSTNYNKVTIGNVSVNRVAGGWAGGTQGGSSIGSNSIGNEVTVNGGTIGSGGTFPVNSVVGGYSWYGSPEIKSNIVTFNAGTAESRIIAGLGCGTISVNKVIIDSGSTVKDVYGGYHYNYNTYSEIDGNEVTINGSTVDGSVQGGWITTTNVSNGNIISNNKVVITGSEVSGNVFGGGLDTGSGTLTISGNEVTLGTDANVAGSIYGGRTLTATGATLSENKVTMNGGTTYKVYGASTQGGEAETNHVVVNAGTAGVSGTIVSGGQLYGAYSYNSSGNSGNVTGNTVTIDKGIVMTTEIYGGNTKAEGTGNKSGDAIKNIVTINGGTLTGDIYGGYSSADSNPSGKVDGNEVNITGGVLDKAKVEINGSNVNTQGVRFIYGGYTYGNNGPSESTIAYKNAVTISGGTFNNNTEVTGGYSNLYNAELNTVSITEDFSSTVGEVTGGISVYNTAKENSVTIAGGTVSGEVYGGKTDNGTAGGAGADAGNKVNISGGAVSGKVYGGYSNSGAATGNTVSITGGTVSGDVYGGYGESGNPTKNSVIISGGTFNGRGSDQLILQQAIFGGYNHNDGSASDNTVTISGGTFIGSNGILIQGGRTYYATGTTNNNIVNLTGTVTGLEKGSLLGGGSNASNTGNELHVGGIKGGANGVWQGKTGDTVNNKVKYVANFDKVVLHSVKWDKDVAALEATTVNNVKTLDITDLKFYTDAAGTTQKTSFEEGESMALLKSVKSDLSSVKLDYKSGDAVVEGATITTEGIVLGGGSTEKTESDGVNGVKLTQIVTEKVLLADEGKTINYSCDVGDVTGVTFNASTPITFSKTEVARDLTGKTFATSNTINAEGLQFKETNEAIAVSDSMTLISNATGITTKVTNETGKTVAINNYEDSQKIKYKATASGTVTSDGSAVKYTVGSVTVSSIDLSGWTGTASDLTQGNTSGWTGAGVSVAGSFTAPDIAANSSQDIVITNKSGFFTDDAIDDSIKYAVVAFSDDEANGVTLAGSQSKGVQAVSDGTNDGAKLVYAVGKKDVTGITLGNMKVDTPRTMEAGYDFTGVTTINAGNLQFDKPEDVKANMTLVANATNLLEGKKVKDADHTQDFTKTAANSVALTASLKGTVETVSGAVNYTYSGTELKTINLANWNGNEATFDATGWTKGASATVETDGLSVTVDPGVEKTVLTVSGGVVLTGITVNGEAYQWKDGGESIAETSAENGVKITAGVTTGGGIKGDGNKIIYKGSSKTVTGLEVTSVDFVKDGVARPFKNDYDLTNADITVASGISVSNTEAMNPGDTMVVVDATNAIKVAGKEKQTLKDFTTINAGKAIDFADAIAGKALTLSGTHQDTLEQNGDKNQILYKVGDKNVNKATFTGEVAWNDSEAYYTNDTSKYIIAATNVDATALKVTGTSTKALKKGDVMTLLSAEGMTATLAKDQSEANKAASKITVNYSDIASGIAFGAEATGGVKTATNAVNYEVTGVTLKSVDLGGWSGTTGNLTAGDTSSWTAEDKSVAVNNADAITVTPKETQAIVIAGSGMFANVNVVKETAFDPVTQNGVTLTGTQTNTIKTAKTAVDNDTILYEIGKKDVKKVNIGKVAWGGAALDGGEDYNYTTAAVNTEGFDVTYAKPEEVAAKQSMTLLKANDSLKAIVNEEKAKTYSIEPVAGVTIDAKLTGKLANSGNNVTFTATENKASALTFGKVEWTGDTPLLDHSKTLKNVSFNDAIVDTSNIDFYKEMYIEADQTTTLVSGFGGNPKDIKGTTYKVGTAFDGEGSATMENGNLVFRTKTSAGVSEQTHKAVMGVEATMGLLASGIGHLDKVLDGFGNVSNAGSDGASTSASIGGGKDRYETGSHVNINSWSAAVGVGARKETKKGTLQYGIFGEYGKGSYTMHSDVGRSDGDAHYAGGGLLAKWTNKHDVYTEASFRLGRVSDTANDLLRDGAGNAYGYDIHATYYGAHVGLGKIFNYKGGKSLDVYGKFFYTKRDGAEFDAKQHYNLDSVNSSVLRIGARYGTTDKKWNWYGGLAYEYEFDGEAKGTVNGTEIRAASIKGSSVRGEFGMRMDATKDNPWRTDISIYGYGGKHRGFGGSVNVAYTF